MPVKHCHVESKSLFDGRLEVVSNGEIYRIKNNKRTPAAVNGTGKRRNYQTTTFCLNGKQKHLYVHRLVAEAFIPNPGNKPQINHKDGNPENNNVGNLEWCTDSENKLHAYANGFIDKMKYGKPCQQCNKLTTTKDNTCTECKIDAKRKRNRQSRINARVNELVGAETNCMTERQRQVYGLRCKGLTVNEIAAEMGVTYQRITQLISAIKTRRINDRSQW